MSIKKLLLAGTAIVAVSAFSVTANAAAITSGATGTWSGAGVGAGDSSTIAEAAAGDTVDLDAGATLTITNDGTNHDGTGVDGAVLGAVTNTAGTANIVTAQGTNTTTLAITIDSANVGGNVSFVNTNGAARQQTVDITSTLTVGGALAVTNLNATTDAMTLAADVNGNLAVTGATTVTGAAGAGAGAAATLTVGGSTATFTGGVTLDDDTGGLASLIFDGTNQTVAGAIKGAGAGEGTLTASDSAIFSGTIGTGGALLAVSGGADGKTVTFSDTLAATTTTVAGTGTVKLDGAATTAIVLTTTGTADINADLTGTIDFTNTAGTATLADGVDVSSTVASTGGATGTLTIEGTSTVTGAVGADGTGLAAINAGADSKVTTFVAEVDATDFKVTGTGSVLFGAEVGAVADTAIDFDGDGSVTISDDHNGTIDASTANYGTVTFDTAAGTTIESIGATNAIKKLVLDGVALTTDVGTINALATDIQDQVMTSATAYTLASGQSLSILATADTVSGNLITGAGDIALNGTVLMSASEAYFEAGTIDADTYTITAAAGDSTTLATYVSNVPGVRFTAAEVGNEVVVTAATVAASEWTDDENAHAQLLAIDGTGTLATVNFDTLTAAINDAATVTARDELIEATQPTVDGGAQASAIDVVAAVQGITDTRIAGLRSGSGMAAGSMTSSSSVWGQGYYNYADQDDIGGQDGYSSDTGGIVLGMDRDDIIDGAVIGLAVNYGVTKAESDNANKTDTDIDNYGVTVYGSYGLEQNMFVNAQLGYATNDITSSRSDCGGAGLVCNGDTDSKQLSAKLLVGKDYVNNKMMFTPKVYASYVKVDTDGYTETGDGTVLIVNDNDVAALNLGVDLETSWELKAREGIMKPSINVGYSYDVINDPVEITSTFAAGGTAFKTTGAEAGESALKLGLGMVYETNANWDLSAKYDASIKEDYQAHNGTIRLTTHF